MSRCIVRAIYLKKLKRLIIWNGEVVVISVWLLIECKQISRQTVREPNGSYSDRPYMYKEASLPLSYTQQLDKSADGTSGTMRGT